jgi:methyl-accepting chemotaxis protein
MASVVQGTSSGDYDLTRGLRLYDTSGDLPARARELWAQVGSDGIEMAREFWRRYARSPEVQEQFDDAKIERLAEKILPYVASKFEQVDQVEWTNHARAYVEKALGSGLTLSTLLAGVNAETEAAFVAIRRKVRSDEEQLMLARTLSEIQAIEIDCFIHHAITMTRREASQVQSRQATEFNTKVLNVVQSCTR